MFYGVEAMRGRPLGEGAQEFGFRFGLAMVLSLMVFATWNDVVQFGWVERLLNLICSWVPYASRLRVSLELVTQKRFFMTGFRRLSLVAAALAIFALQPGQAANAQTGGVMPADPGRGQSADRAQHRESYLAIKRG